MLESWDAMTIVKPQNEPYAPYEPYRIAVSQTPLKLWKYRVLTGPVGFTWWTGGFFISRENAIKHAHKSIERYKRSLWKSVEDE